MVIATSSQTIKRGDSPTFLFTITDKDDNAVNLSNVQTITFSAKKRLTDPNVSAIFSKTCTIDSPATAGKCRAKLTTSETDNLGSFFAEVQIIFNDLTVLTAGDFDLLIKQDVIL